MRNYGATVLESMPRDAILLSHSDMQWNTVRYLQVCEGMRPDVTHLNFQVRVVLFCRILLLAVNALSMVFY